MFKLLKILITVSLFSFTFNFPLKSQTPIDNSNLDEFVDHLDDTFGSILGTSKSQIRDFIANMLIGSDPSRVIYPNPKLEELKSTSIDLFWDPIPNIPQYEVGILNLYNGTNRISSHSTESSNLYNLPNLPAGLYLVTVQSNDLTDKSTPNIIILEKAVHKVVFSDSPGCILPPVVEILDMPNCPFNDGCWIKLGIEYNDKFQLQITNTQTSEILGVIYGEKVDFGNGNKVYNFTTTCNNPSFTIEEENSILFFYNEKQELIGTFTFTPKYNFVDDNITIKFARCSFEQQRIGTITINKVPEKQQISFESKNKQALVYPNPFSEEFNLRLSQKDCLMIEIVDLTGRTVHRKAFNNGIISDKNISINTMDIPPGQYFSIIHYPEKTERIPLVKF